MPQQTTVDPITSMTPLYGISAALAFQTAGTVVLLHRPEEVEYVCGLLFRTMLRQPLPILMRSPSPEVTPPLLFRTATSAWYVKAPVPVAVTGAPEEGFVTTTFTAPATPAGVVQVIDVAETTVNEVQAAPPTVTVASESKLSPVIVITVPPPMFPLVGLTDVNVGVVALAGPAVPNTSAVATSDTTTAPIAAIRPAPSRRSVLVFPRDPTAATSPSQDPSRRAESFDDLKRSSA